MMDVATVFALALQCAPTAPADIVTSVSIIESNGSPSLVKINGEIVSSSNADEAIASATQGMIAGENVTLGLGAVDLKHFSDRDLTITDALSACKNLEVLGEVLNATRSHAPNEAAEEQWLSASAIYSIGTSDGSPAEDFISELNEIRSQLPEQVAREPVAKAAQAITASPASNQVVQDDKNEASWDVFSRSKTNSKLVFQ